MILLVAFGASLVWILAGGICSRFILKSMIREAERLHPGSLKTEDDYIRFTEDRKASALFLGILGWPFVWVVLLCERAMTGSLKGNQRLARLKAEEELARVKRLARDNGMSFPDA